MSKLFIIAHKNSDTDAVCSSLAYAELKKKLGFKAKAILASGGLNKETKFVLDYFKIEPPSSNFKLQKNDQIVLVDHNEPSQIDSRINIGKISEIIDHHRLGGLSLPGPILIRIEPLGCSCSIIYKICQEKEVKIDQKIAQLLIAGLLSDTLNCHSPTTTKEDKEIALKLNKIAGLNIDAFSAKMFEAKSDISDIPTSELITKDYKEFKMGKYKVGIGVWETVAPQPVLERKEEILELILKKKTQEKLDYVLFGVVDILEKKTYLLVLEEEKKLVKNVFKRSASEEMVTLEGIVSRKKQLVPPLEEYLKINC